MKTNDILHNLHIDGLTPMQQVTAESYSINKDLVLLSPTGSGKTIAFLLPLVMSLDPDIQDVQAVILAPSRELAQQTESVFKLMGSPFKVMSCHGGRPAMDEHRVMNSLHPSVIVSTPGRLCDHLRKQNFNTQYVTTIVIDEFDKCLEFGFQEEMSEAIALLPSLQKRVLLSATDIDSIPKFVGVGATAYGKAGKSNYIKLDYSALSDAESRLELYTVKSPVKDKLETLYNLLCTLGKQSSLVFVNYREGAERVTGFLQAKKFPSDMFHGGMEQADRERSLYKFRNGSCPVLISTDLAARGLDISGIDNIIHYHLPLNEDAFTHRNGRTARWEANGRVFIILGPEEKLPEYVKNEMPEFNLPETIPQPPKQEWTTIYIGKGKKDKLNKIDIVGFLYKKGGLEHDDVGQIDVKDHYSFVAVRRSKVKQMLTLVSGEKIKGMRTLLEEAH